MADYYPLIAKAVSGLPNSTPETRSAIYQRARGALLGQLRRLEPPIPESDVARESAALEEAIARLEADLAPPPGVAPAAPLEVEQPASEPARPDAPSPAESAAIESRPPTASESAAVDVPLAPPEAAPFSPAASEPAIEAPAEQATARTATLRPPQPPPPAFFKLRRDKPSPFAPPQRSDAAPTRRAPSFDPAVRPQLFERPPGSARAGEDDQPSQDQGDAVGEPFQPGAPDPPPSGPGVKDSLPEGAAGNTFDDQEATPPDGRHGAVDGDANDESAASRRVSPALAKPRSEAQRPFAPQPAREDTAPRRLWIVGFVVGLLVLLIAVAAFQLRDRPEDLRQKAATPVIAPETSSNGKIVDRVGAGQDSTQGAPASPSADNTPTQAAGAAKSAADTGETTASGGRAALLVEAPAEASKVKTYLGSVVWKVDNVSNGPGEPLSTAVHAEVDIPEEKLQTTITLQKNFDGNLPASHTIKIQFNEAADSPLGAIQQISVPQMRREDTATGDGLSGIPVTITGNSFLVGLTRGNAEASNIDLLTSREWIDVPMLLGDGKIAKLTFEKGPTGVRAITDALSAWKVQ